MSAPAGDQHEPTHEEIAQRAYEISLRDEGSHNAEENWHRAERELRQEQERSGSDEAAAR
jgi:hypothetical protein